MCWEQQACCPVHAKGICWEPLRAVVFTPALTPSCLSHPSPLHSPSSPKPWEHRTDELTNRTDALTSLEKLRQRARKSRSLSVDASTATPLSPSAWHTPRTELTLGSRATGLLLLTAATTADMRNSFDDFLNVIILCAQRYVCAPCA